MDQPPRELEPDERAMREMLAQAAERVFLHLRTLPRQPAAASAEGVERVREVAGWPIAEAGRPLGPVLEWLFERAIPASFNTAGPGYLAYIPGGGLWSAALADFVACATNRYVGVWQAAPVLATIESAVVRWLCDRVGFPAGSGGYLASGGSLANFSAVVAARCERLGEELAGGTIYLTDQAHHSVEKAARLAGFPRRALRLVPTDSGFRMRPDRLAEQVAADRRAGLRPFLVVASAGTTSTGAVDDLAALADLARREGLWLHVDAAYGGFFLLTERGRRALAGIERADSAVLDPHKGLFLPYGTGALVARDAGALVRSHDVSSDYMPPYQDDPERMDFCRSSPELSREFRGLRVWLPLMLHGVEAFRAYLDEKLDLARRAADRVRAWPEVEMVAEPELSVVAFRRGAAAGEDGEAQDRANRAWLERTNARGRVHLSGTKLGGRFTLRLCVLHLRTHAERLEMALEDLEAALHEG